MKIGKLISENFIGYFMKSKSEYFVHDTSFIDDQVTIGKDTKIWHFCHVSSGSVIGEQCTLGQNSFVGNNVKIGKNAKFKIM